MMYTGEMTLTEARQWQGRLREQLDEGELSQSEHYEARQHLQQITDKIADLTGTAGTVARYRGQVGGREAAQ